MRAVVVCRRTWLTPSPLLNECESSNPLHIVLTLLQIESWRLFTLRSLLRQIYGLRGHWPAGQQCYVQSFEVLEGLYIPFSRNTYICTRDRRLSCSRKYRTRALISVSGIHTINGTSGTHKFPFQFPLLYRAPNIIKGSTNLRWIKEPTTTMTTT